MGGNVAEAARDVENGAYLYGGSMAVHSEKKAWGSLEAWRLGVVGVWSWGGIDDAKAEDRSATLQIHSILYKHIVLPTTYIVLVNMITLIDCDYRKTFVLLASSDL